MGNTFLNLRPDGSRIRPGRILLPSGHIPLPPGRRSTMVLPVFTKAITHDANIHYIKLNAMAVHYKIKPIENSRFPNEKSSYKVTLVTTGNVGIEELAAQMSDMSSFTAGDLYGLIRNLVTIISTKLANGETVTLENLGTFSISAELNNPPENPEEITGNNINLKRICFKPAPFFKQQVKDKIAFHRLAPDIKRWRK